jgi:hypothetical protein
MTIYALFLEQLSVLDMYSLLCFFVTFYFILYGYLGSTKGESFFISGGILSVGGAYVHQSMWHFLAVDVMDRLTGSVFTPLFDTFFYKASHGKMVFHFYVFRELVLSIVGVLFWSIVALLFILPFQWIGVFGLASVGTLLSLHMAKDRE